MPPSPIDYFSAFDGWGSGAEALRQLGVSIGEHWASEHPEMNPWAVKTSQALNPNIQHLGPIEGVNPGRFPCKPGLFTAGPPCQDVSIGTPNRQGLSGARSGLFYPTADLWDALGNPHGWFESVASMTPQTRDAISNRLGISPVLLDAGHVGGVSRPRLFWPTFPVKPMEGQGVDPRELIVPDRHLFDPFNEHRTYRLTEGTQGYEKNTSKLWKPMRGWDLPKARAWTRAYGAHGIPYDTVQLEPGGQIWRWTPRAGEMLHGIPEGTMAAAGAPWTEQKKMIGNGWDIPTVKHLLKAYMDHTQPGWDQPVAPQQDRIEIWTPQNNAPVSLAEPTVAPKMVAPAPGSEMFQSPNKPSYAPVGTTFTTERGGSVYTIGENGVTQRNKGASGGVHEGDVGLKPFSERTMYVSPKAANVLSRIYANSPDGPQYNARVNLLPDGQVEYIWYKRGPDGTPKGARTIIPQDMTSFEPKVGMHPVEILPNGSRHIGSPIASVSPPVSPPEPPADKELTSSVDMPPTPEEVQAALEASRRLVEFHVPKVYRGSATAVPNYQDPPKPPVRSKMSLPYGTHWTDDPGYAKGYIGKSGAVHEASLTMRQPLDLIKGAFRRGEPGFEQALDLAKRLGKKAAAFAIDYYDPEINAKVSEPQLVVITSRMLDAAGPNRSYKALIDSGYDGIIYEPEHGRRTAMSNYATNISPEIKWGDVTLKNRRAPKSYVSLTREGFTLLDPSTGEPQQTIAVKPEPPTGPRTGSIRPNQGGYATPKTLVGTTAGLGFPAASAYYDAIQNGATHEQAAKAAAHAGLMGALFSVAYAAAPKLVEPAMGGLIGADATRDAITAATGQAPSSSSWLPTVGGLAGVASMFNPVTRAATMGYGMGKMAEPFARPVVQPLMKAATGAYPQEEAAQTRRQFRQQHRAVMPQQPPVQLPRGMAQKPQRPSEVQPGDLTRALMQGRGDAVQEVRPTRRLTPEQEEAIRQHVARLRKYTPPNADRRLLPGGF